MLQKSKSKKVWQLKYLLLIPILTGMLIYTSCEKESQGLIVENIQGDELQLKVNSLEILSTAENARLEQLLVITGSCISGAKTVKH